jgi:GntR family transcriptional regulator
VCLPVHRYGSAMIDADRPGPPWRQLADDLRARITAGEWTGRLPGEKSLAQEYGVALGTLRKAMALLRSEGLIRTDRGWGSYVTGQD